MFLCVHTAPSWLLGSHGSITYRCCPGRGILKSELASRCLTTVTYGHLRSFAPTVYIPPAVKVQCNHGEYDHSTQSLHIPYKPIKRSSRSQLHTKTFSSFARSDIFVSQQPLELDQKEPGVAHRAEESSRTIFTESCNATSEPSLVPFPRKAPSIPRIRQLPRQFDVNIRQISSLVLDGRDVEFVRSHFAETIRIAHEILPGGGLTTLEGWIHGEWDDLEASKVSCLLIGSILTSPRQLLGILEILDTFVSEFSVKSSCLALAGRIYKELLLRDVALSAKFNAEVDKLRTPHAWPRRGMRASELGLLLWRSNPKQSQILVSDFVEKYPAPTARNALQMAMFCSYNGMENAAMHFLTALPSEELQSPSLLTLKCCQVLLRNDVVESTVDGPNFKYLPRLLEKGLTPDNVLYSRIMERALESGYAGVAWDIFRHLQKTDVEITGWTYLLLLRHAYNEKNVAGVQEIMSEIHQQDALYRNIPLLTWSMNIVRRIFHTEKGMTTAESWSHILALYDRVFARQPLVNLGMLRHTDLHGSRTLSTGVESDREVTQPDAQSLSFTIWAYVLCHRNAKQVTSLWTRIKALVEAGDVAVVDCMKYDLIYNAFLWLHLGDKRTMAGALEVLQYMLAKQFCAPTDRTWSILICGFLRLKQRHQAQQVYRLMKQYDMNLREVRREYWGKRWTFEFFEQNLDAVLDEDMMPDGTEFGQAEALRPRSVAGEVSYETMTKTFVRLDPQEMESEESERIGPRNNWRSTATAST